MEENIATTTIINGNPSTDNQLIKYTPGKAITLSSDTFYHIKDGHGDVKEICMCFLVQYSKIWRKGINA